MSNTEQYCTAFQTKLLKAHGFEPMSENFSLTELEELYKGKVHVSYWHLNLAEAYAGALILKLQLNES